MSKRSTGIVLSYFSMIVNMICSLILSAFLLRTLGDTEYGLYQTVSAFAMNLVMLEFGIGTVMTRNVSVCKSTGDEQKLKKSISTLWYMTALLSAIILLLSFLFSRNIGVIYQNSMTETQIEYAQRIFTIIMINLIVSFFTNTLNGLLLGMEQYSYAKLVTLLKVAVRCLLLVAVISVKPYSIYISIVDALIGISIFLVTFIFCKREYKVIFSIRQFDKAIVAESMPLCLALLLQGFINQANDSVDKLIIGIKMSLESVALYSVAQYIYSLLSSIMSMPISMYMPQLAKDMNQGVHGKALTQTLVAPCRLVVLIGGTLLFAFVAVGKQFIGIVYGLSKQEAWYYALITILPMFVNMTNGVIINVLDIANKRLTRSLSLLCTTILNIILTWLLISHYGILGAVCGTAVSLILGNILVMNIYYQKKMRIDIIWLFCKAYKGVLPSQIMSCAAGFAIARCIDNIYISFFVGGSIYVLLCAGLMAAFGLNKNEKQVLKRLLYMMSGRRKTSKTT